MKGGERRGGDALGLALKAFDNQSLNASGIEVKHARDQTERENVFALVLGRAADGFHSQLGDRAADVTEFSLQILARLHMRCIVQNDTAFLYEIDVVIVAVLIEGHQHIGFVAGCQHLAGAEAHLEDGRAAGNGGGNGHVRHDLLLASPG